MWKFKKKEVEENKDPVFDKEKYDDAFVVLENINKVYDNNVQAVFDFNLAIKEHEFIVFVGPSGCGKSTTLRMIAGLEEITDGNLFINKKFANDMESKDRDIAMVFQNYALYPHMTVYENMAFGLKIRRLDKEEINKRVHEAAKILQIEEYLDRRPKALSGGQCQRVALGRAIVRHAKLFLMDEPLSNLDAKLRVSMRSEIVELHKQIGATTIYVTHDQTEAMTMADRIVVMKDGYIQQIGTPKEIYNNPANLFVAGFIGAPAMNFLDVTIKDHIVYLNDLEIMKVSKDKVLEGQYVLGIRPEDIRIVEDKENAIKCSVKLAELLGSEYYVHTEINSVPIVIKLNASGDIKKGDVLNISFNENKVHLFDKETTKAI